MSAKKILVIVESPGKIAKIQSYLGSNYLVKASVGHIIDLDPKTMSVDIDDNFKPHYVNKEDKSKVIADLKSAYKNAKDVLLASDEDREGEFIAWSVAYVLKLKDPKRIGFHEITKSALTNAVKNPRPLDQNLINAQQTRRILDRIVGYSLSPLVSAQLNQHNLSAGRVQSVVVRLILDKENEIKAFFEAGAESFYKVNANFLTKDNKTTFIAQLYNNAGKDKSGHMKGDIAHLSEKDDTDNPEQVMKFLKQCVSSTFTVDNVFDKASTQGPSAPFITSTLQQEASKKFGFNVKRTMQAAQKLYEGGHITYMRTDSVVLAEDAHEAIKELVTEKYGENYYKRTEYKSKSKNAQEAHEAIRPTHFEAQDLSGENLGADEIKLYNLIWKRTVASQMAPAQYKVTVIQITISKTDDYYFMTTLKTLTFPGFLSVYNITNIEKEEDENGEQELSEANVPQPGDTLTAKQVIAKQEYTRPTTRYNEASLVKKLEDLGIGRPSTFANMITTVQDRKYVEKADIPGVSKPAHTFTLLPEKKKIEREDKNILLGKENAKLVPTELGKLVTEFLLEKFPEIMDYKFTAEMEDKLDDISNGKKVWYKVLENFYKEFEPKVEQVKKEESKYIEKSTRILGKDPNTEQDVVVKQMKFGPVVVIGEQKPRKIHKPLTLENITLEEALKIMEFPKTLGKLSDKEIVVYSGPTGYYLKWDDKSFNVPADKDGDLTLKDAIAIIKKQILGEYEDKDILVLSGPHGRYLKWNNNSFPIPKDKTGDVTLEEAIEIIKAGKEGKKPLKIIDTDKKRYEIREGKFGQYVMVIDKKEKKSKVNKKPLMAGIPKGTDIENLTAEQVEKIIKDYMEFKKKKKSVEKARLKDEKKSEKKTGKKTGKKTAPKKKKIVVV